MADIRKRNGENHHDGSGSLVRQWDASTNSFSAAHPDSASFRMRVEQVLDLLLRRKWLIIFTCLLVVGATTAYTYLQVPVYRASSLVLVEKNAKSASFSSPGFSGNSGASSLLFNSDRSLENELLLLRSSRSLRQRVADRLIERGIAGELVGRTRRSPLGVLVDQGVDRLQRMLGIGGEAPPESTVGSSSASQSRKPSTAAVAAQLGGRVQFSQSSQASNAIRIVASDEDPQLAPILANVYMQEYVELTREASRAQLSASRKYLEDQVQKRREELQSIERKIQAYQRQEGAIALNQREGSLVSRISNVEAELEKARLELNMRRKRLKSLRAQLDSIQPSELADRVESSYKQEIDALQSKIAELKMSKQELLMQSGPSRAADSAQVAQIDQRIQSLQERVSSLSDKYVNQIFDGGVSAEAGAQRVEELRRQIGERRLDIAGLEARINVLSDRLQQYEQELSSIPEKSMEVAQLRRSQESAEQMYQYVVKQLQNVRVQEESELGYASSVAEAAAPGQLVRPQPQRNISLGLILGLIGGIGLALARDLLDNRVYKPDRLGEMGYHEIGVIPNLTPLIEDQLGGQSMVEVGGRDVRTSLISAVEPHSAAAESYRQVLTNVQLGPSGDDVTTLLVTSPGAGDGKSVTAANLAIVMAQSGKSTLLIDADLHRPRVHKLFNLSGEPGLVDALKNDLREHIERPGIDNLCVLPAGGGVGNPSEVLSSSDFVSFLRNAEKYFDFVILDSPPVLASTDAQVLSTHCDRALCVVRAGATTEPELDRAMHNLGDVGAPVEGVVFNGFDVSMAYGYKYRYRHYDQYGHYDHYSALPGESE